MSQNSLHTLEPTWISIPFAKFSYNTCPNGTRNFRWSHVSTRNDLDFVISKVRSMHGGSGNYDARPIMKVTAGAELLENQDLSELVSFIRDHDPLVMIEPPVQIVVKCPFLAMRFPKSASSVRRIQLKFHNEHDFGRARTILEEVGLPIKDSGPGAPANARAFAPSPVPSVFSSTSSSSSATTITPFPRSSSAVEGNANLHAPFRLSMLPSSSTLYGAPLAREQSDLPYERPNSALTYSTSHLERHSTPLSLPASTCPRSLATLNDPVKQPLSLCVSQDEKEPQSQRLSFPDVLVQLPDYSAVQAHPSASHFIQDIPLYKGGPSRHANGLIRQSSSSPFFQPSHNTASSKFFDFERRTSTPTVHRDIYELSVPPRRVLPFPKPRATSTVILPSVADMTPLPKPTPVQSTVPATDIPIKTPIATAHATKAAPKKRVAQRKKPAPVITEEITNDTLFPAETSSLNLMEDPVVDPMVEEEPSPLAAKSVARPPSTAGLQSKATAAKKRAAPPPRPASAVKKPKTVDQGTQTQTLSGRNHTVAGRCSPNQQAIEGASSILDDVSGNYLDQLDAYITQYKARPTPKELWESAKYAEADVQERQAILNDFICDNLENDDFRLLCEDTETAWRKIGLGM